MKPQKGKSVKQPQLPDGTFVERDAYDPLFHNTQDFFWFHVEPYFNPITTHDVDKLKAQPLTAPTVPRLGSKEGKNEQIEEAQQPGEETKLARIEGYPVMQRLVAALIDEGKGKSNATKPVRSSINVEPPWIGVGNGLSDVNSYNHMIEDRLKKELRERGLFEEQDNQAQLLDQFRKSCAHLRNLEALNASTKSNIAKKINAELITQAARRQEKLKRDKAEIQYLEHMIDKTAKRGKGRFAKLLNNMHPNRHLNVGDEIIQNKKPERPVPDKSLSKSIRKRRKRASDRGNKHHPDQNDKKSSDTTDNLAPELFEIIRKRGNHVSIDDIVTEIVHRIPHLGIDMKDARRRVTQSLSFARKPYRFKKSEDGIHYSAIRI